MRKCAATPKSSSACLAVRLRRSRFVQLFCLTTITLGVFARHRRRRRLSARKIQLAQRRNRIFDHVDERLVCARRDRQLQR